jgi:lipopolysaccharide transport protein LptA
MNETKPMKILNWVAGLGLAFSPLLAQEARAPIESDWAEMDLKAGVYHYSGNVRVDVPGLLKLTCGDLLAQPQKDTNRLDSLIATTNVVIEIQRQGRNPGDAPIVMRAYGDRAVYTATNEVVTLTGADTRIVDPSGTIRGHEIVYDVVNNRVRIPRHKVTELSAELFKNSGLFRRPTNAPAGGSPK